jgi:uncharacterized protein
VTIQKSVIRQPTWQRIILLIVLGYEGTGALLGGILLAAAPDGRLMDMSVAIMRGVFPDFRIPGSILIGFGILNAVAFFAVWRRTRTDWLMAGLALGGLAAWFTVEIAILRQVHWLQAMWGLPVLVGGLVALPLVPYERSGGQAFLKRHPVLAFYALTFTISWAGMLLVAGGLGGLPGRPEEVQRLFPLSLLVLFAGPSVGGLVATALVDGRTGLGELRSRLLHWRVGASWYAAALLPAPALVAAVVLALSLLSPAFVPGVVTTEDKVSLIVLSIVAALIGGGFLEELGETGVAVARLRERHSAMTTALTVGVLWGVWHFMVIYWAGGNLSGGHTLATWGAGILFFYLGVLPAYRVLMVWVYDRTQSLLVAMLMHASLSASTLILQPLTAGVPFMVWNLALAAVLWVVVAVIALAYRGRLSRRALHARTAMEPSLLPLRRATPVGDHQRRAS